MYIVSIEGVDGSGKTTVASLLFKELTKCFLDFVVELYHEPAFFTTEIYSTNIHNSKYLTLLFLLSRRKLLQSIKKEKNKIIILDRYIDSTLVYQVLMQKVIDFRNFIYIHQKLIFDFSEFPDITFVLHANVKDIEKRIKEKQNHKLFDKENLQFIQDLYKKIAFIFSNRLFYFFDTSTTDANKIVEEMLKIIKTKIVIPYYISKGYVI